MNVKKGLHIAFGADVTIDDPGAYTRDLEQLPGGSAELLARSSTGEKPLPWALSRATATGCRRLRCDTIRCA